MTDKKISPHIERFKTLQDYAQYFINEKGKAPNVSCVDEPVEVVKFAEQKVHPDYIRAGQDTYYVVVYDDYDYNKSSITSMGRDLVCTQSILYKFEYDSYNGTYSQRDYLLAPTPKPNNGGFYTIGQFIYPTKIFEDFEGTFTRSVNLDSTTKYDATTTVFYKAVHRTLGNKDINIFQISCASDKVALNEKIEFPGGYMYYPSPVYTIESMNDDVILDDGFLFGARTDKIIKQDDRHFILALSDTASLPNNRFELPIIMIPFHYKDLPELTFFKCFDTANLPALYEEVPQAEFEFYLNIYSTPQKVEANDLVYKQYSPGFNVTYEGKKLYSENRIGEVEGDNKMLGSVELDGSALEQGLIGYWETSNLTSGAHELVAYDGEHNEIGRMTFNVKMPQFDYVLYDANKNVIEPDEISRYVIEEASLNNDYLIDIHGVYDGKIYQGVSSSWADGNMFNEEITDWRDYIVLSPKVNNHNFEVYYEIGAEDMIATELFKMKPSWCSRDTRYNIIDGNNNIAEICFYYEVFTPYLENGNITVDNLNLTYGYYERPYKYYDTDNIYFYHVYAKDKRQQVFLSQLGGNNYFNATYDTNNFLRFGGGNGEHKIGWIINPEVDLPVGDYKVTNAFVQYEGLRLDLWDEITFSVIEPYLENGTLTVDNLKQSSWGYFGICYNTRDDYFYSVDKYGYRTQTSLDDATLNATFDTSIIEHYTRVYENGWRIKTDIEVHSGNYEITNAYLEYNGTRLDLWSSANITVVNQTSYEAKNENDETIDPGQNLNWTYDANGVLTSEPFKFTKHNVDDTPADANITQDVNYIIDRDNEGLYDLTLFNVEVTRVNNNEYFVVKYTPKAELQTVRNYRVPWIDFTYNDAFNEKVFYCGPMNYVPQNGSMQIYITDAGAVDSVDKETYSFTSSVDKTLTYDNYITYCDDPNYQGESVVQTITTTGTGITVEYPFTENAPTGFKLTLQPNASGTITIAYQKSPDTDFVPEPRTYNITAPVLKKVISGPLTATNTVAVYSETPTQYDSIVYATNSDNKCAMLTYQMTYNAETGLYTFDHSNSTHLFSIVNSDKEYIKSVELVDLNDTYVNFFLSYASQIPDLQNAEVTKTDEGNLKIAYTEGKVRAFPINLTQLLTQVGQDLTFREVIVTTENGESGSEDYLDFKAPNEGGWGNRKLYGYYNNFATNNGTYELAIFDESGANHTFNYDEIKITGNAEIRSTTTTDTDDPRGEGLTLIYKIAISGEANIVVPDKNGMNVFGLHFYTE